MRKNTYKLVLALLLSAAAVSGCRKHEKIDLTGIHSTEAETMAAETTKARETGEKEPEKETEKGTETEAAKETGGSSSLSVRSKIATEKNGKLSVEYPILSGLPTGSPQEKINGLLKTNAIQILKSYELDGEKDSLEVKCRTITLDRNNAVFSFTGTLSADGAAHPQELFYTVSVDLVKGVLRGLSDYADAYTMAGYILSDDCVLEKPAASKEVLSELKAMDIETLTAILENSDFTSQKDGDFPQAFSYENQGVIYMAVPVSHAAGDYAIVRYAPDTK